MSSYGRLGIDTNVLILAHLPSMPDHARVRRFLMSHLARPYITLVVTPIVLHEFVHVITDRRRFEPPVEMAEALSVASSYLNRSNVECVAVDEASTMLAFEMLDRFHLGRKRVADTLLAATLIRHGIDRIATCKSRDFKMFDAITVVDPRSVEPEGP